MFKKRKQQLLVLINDEKGRLSPSQLEILREVSSRILRNPEGFKPISDSQYAVLSESEKTAANAEKRIDYIISKEIEYLLISRKVPEKLVTWFKRNKAAVLSLHLFGAVGAAFSYYLEHADKINPLVHKLLAGAHFKKHRPVVAPRPVSELTPDELFAEEGVYPDVVGYLVELSTEGYSDLSNDDVEALNQ